MRLVVTGSEGSGTNYVGRVLAEHPESPGRLMEWDGHSRIEEGITHVSIPHGLGVKVAWVDADVLRDSRLVIVRRSLLDAAYSAYRRFYREGRARLALDHQLHALKTLQQLKDALGVGRVHEMAYEGLGCEPWEGLFGFVGWERAHRPAEQFENRNGRYLSNDVFLRRVTRQRLGPARIGELTFGRRFRSSFSKESRAAGRDGDRASSGQSGKIV